MAVANNLLTLEDVWTQAKAFINAHPENENHSLPEIPDDHLSVTIFFASDSRLCPEDQQVIRQPGFIDLWMMDNNELIRRVGVIGPEDHSLMTKFDLIRILLMPTADSYSTVKSASSSIAMPVSPLSQSLPVSNMVNYNDKSWTTDRFSIPIECLHGYIPQAEIGRGAEGCVYNICTQDGCEKYVIKIENLDDKAYDIYTFDPDILNFLSNHGISVPLAPDHDGRGSAWKCDGLSIIDGKCIPTHFGVTVMEKWDIELSKNMVSLTPENKALIGHKLNMLHDLGYIHGDIYNRNIMIKYTASGQIEDLAFIDFGLTKRIDIMTLDDLEFYNNHWENVYGPGSYYNIRSFPQNITRNNMPATEKLILAYICEQ